MLPQSQGKTGAWKELGRLEFRFSNSVKPVSTNARLSAGYYVLKRKFFSIECLVNKRNTSCDWNCLLTEGWAGLESKMLNTHLFFCFVWLNFSHTQHTAINLTERKQFTVLFRNSYTCTQLPTTNCPLGRIAKKQTSTLTSSAWTFSDTAQPDFGADPLAIHLICS